MKPSIELIRLEQRHRYGTFGVLKLNKEIIGVTLEPPYRSNTEFVSNIPASQYDCYPFNSEKFGKTWRVADVPNRTGIIFHPGNTVSDTSGCIIIAEHFGKLRGDRAVLNSGKTFSKFIAMLEGHGIATLTIYEVY